ncbi:MAG: hypothetical protein KKG60_02585 [Nanoarchaeota archaeon]|nr:hypothetical protein [Nanoarchaeota archaeon]
MSKKQYKKETVYKQVMNPEEIRKNSLNLAVGTIKLLEEYEKHKKIKKKKEFLVSELKKLVLRTEEDLKEIKKHFPEVEGVKKGMKPIAGMRSKSLELEEKEDIIEKQVERDDADQLSKLHIEAEKLREKLATLEI